MILLEHFNEYGYCVLPELITASECDHYKSLLEKNYTDFSNKYAENVNKSSHGLDDKSLEKVVYNLHNKDLSWFKLFEHPAVIDILDNVLLEGSYENSEPYYLNNISARCPLKGNMGQQLHLDSRLPGINYCIVANVLWMLDDFTETNGATRVVPKSQKFMTFAENGKINEHEKLVTGKKGTALIFNANLWHGGGGNCDGTSRWALALGYARWFIKPAFDFMSNTPIEIYDKLTQKQKSLLGFYAVPPKDEFTRVRRRSLIPEVPFDYCLPKV